MTHASRTAALLLATGTLLQGGNAQCTSEPGYHLFADPLFAIGEPLSVTAAAPANRAAVLLLSLSGTPTPSFFGTFCIGPDIYWAGMFMTTGGSDYIEWCRLPCDPDYINARGFMQYVAFDTPGLNTWHFSNPVNFSITDQLGAAIEFNAFAVNDVAFDSGKTGGRIAAGQDVLLDNYQVGDDLANSQGARDDVIAGRDLNAKDSTVLNGNGVWGNQGFINNSTAPNGQFVGRAPPFVIADENLLLKRRWTQFGDLAVTGTNQANGTVLTLTGTSTMMNVFMIDQAELATKTTVLVNVPAGATAIVNITGFVLEVTQDLTITGATQGCAVLWNFCEATSIHFQDVNIDGTVLAPCAAVTVDMGMLNGSLIAAFASGFGNCLNQVRFCGCLQLVWP